jgi:alpha-L-fucosidase
MIIGDFITTIIGKTPYEVISIFVDAVANGGNLLLDMGANGRWINSERTNKRVKRTGCME